MIKVKVSFPGFNDKIDISQFAKNQGGIFNDCEFYINREDVIDADFWFCIEGTNGNQEVCTIRKDRIIFLTAEVAWPRFYYDSILKTNFLQQFAQIYTCHDIYGETVRYDLPFLPWMINANHGPSIFEKSDKDYNYLKNLKRIPKPKLISVFCSMQTWTEGHRMRLKFVRALKKHFGDQLDWFGNGINKVDRKWEGIAPYQYHIVLENQSRNNVITEKLYDSYLGLAYPIYYGAPNVSDYFDSSSFTSIDICDLNGSIQIIEDVINKNTYEESLDDLLLAKDRVLNQYNFFERISKICTETIEKQKYDKHAKEKVIIKSLMQFSVVEDLSAALRNRRFKVICERLIFYYPGHLFKKISDYLLQKYNNRN